MFRLPFFYLLTLHNSIIQNINSTNLLFLMKSNLLDKKLPKSKNNGQLGIVSLPILLVIIGLLAFIGVASLAPFKDGLQASLFGKKISFAATTITVDPNLNTHPISPYIYGTAANTDAYQKTMGVSVSRWGGNQVSRYNWESEDSNAGVDWGLCLQPYLNRNYGAFSNVDYGSASNSGFSIRDGTNAAKSLGMAQLFTVPAVGWVAKDGNNGTCSTGVPGSDGIPLVSQSNDEAAISGYDPVANRNLTSIKSQLKKGSAFVYPPNKTDNIVYQDELINWLVGQVGTANTGGVKFYAFDNEFDLWSHTHRDIHPAQTGYDALWNKFQTFANAVKDIDSTAMTTGPVNWGWIAYWNSPLGDRSTHENLPLLKWFLRQAKNAEAQSGRRILDVLDVHYYPQGGQYSNDVSTNMQALRLRSTRELWDPTYVTESWQTCCEGGPQLQIIRRLKQWIAEEYPGTKIGITEWNWGADNHINGALTIADVLGIFGREDVYLANYWTTPADLSPGYWAWRMFRNYDGNFSKFGDVSINASVPSTDVDKASFYASKDSVTNALKIMVINKQPSLNYDLNLSLANFSPGNAAKVYRYAQTDTSKINQLADAALSGNSLVATVPAYSITLFVIPASTTPTTSPTPSPSAPISAPVTPQPSTKPGDLDGNNKVDIFDYNILLTNFGKTGTGIQGDLDQNNKVDIFDYNILLTNFGK